MVPWWDLPLEVANAKFEACQTEEEEIALLMAHGFSYLNALRYVSGGRDRINLDDDDEPPVSSRTILENMTPEEREEMRRENARFQERLYQHETPAEREARHLRNEQLRASYGQEETSAERAERLLEHARYLMRCHQEEATPAERVQIEDYLRRRCQEATTEERAALCREYSWLRESNT